MRKDLRSHADVVAAGVAAYTTELLIAQAEGASEEAAEVRAKNAAQAARTAKYREMGEKPDTSSP